MSDMSDDYDSQQPLFPDEDVVIKSRRVSVSYKRTPKESTPKQKRRASRRRSNNTPAKTPSKPAKTKLDSVESPEGSQQKKKRRKSLPSETKKGKELLEKLSQQVHSDEEFELKEPSPPKKKASKRRQSVSKSPRTPKTPKTPRTPPNRQSKVPRRGSRSTPRNSRYRTPEKDESVSESTSTSKWQTITPGKAERYQQAALARIESTVMTPNKDVKRAAYKQAFSEQLAKVPKEDRDTFRQEFTKLLKKRKDQLEKRRKSMTPSKPAKKTPSKRKSPRVVNKRSGSPGKSTKKRKASSPKRRSSPKKRKTKRT